MGIILLIWFPTLLLAITPSSNFKWRMQTHFQHLQFENFPMVYFDSDRVYHLHVCPKYLGHSKTPNSQKRKSSQKSHECFPLTPTMCLQISHVVLSPSHIYFAPTLVTTIAQGWRHDNYNVHIHWWKYNLQKLQDFKHVKKFHMFF